MMDTIITFIKKNIIVISIIVAIVIYYYINTVKPQEAVKILATAATSTEQSPPEKIQPIMNIATTATTTQEGKQAVKDLAQVAISPEAMPVSVANNTAKVAIESMRNNF